MPTKEENLSMWKEYNWDKAGEEWSETWGGSKNQWAATVYPRIMKFIPCENVLEIAFGYGRWTKFLLGNCKNYSGVDICEKCVNECSKKFPKGKFFLTNGVDLSMIEDNSIDFCFSYDSLVHVDFEVLKEYIPQILDKLKPGGAAFLHHSNLAAVSVSEEEFTHKRTKDCSAKKVKELVIKNGGFVYSQEIISWGCVRGLDCYTILHKNPKIKNIDEEIVNDSFLEECHFAKNVLSRCP